MSAPNASVFAYRPRAAFRAQPRITTAVVILLSFVLIPLAEAHPEHSNSSSPAVKIPLSGGLLHVSGFYLNATVGKQVLNLMVSTSYSSLIVPRKGCVGCRIGDRRYDPQASKATVIPCDHKNCALDAAQCDAKTCFNCNSKGNCCVEKSNNCAFNMFYGDGSSGNGTLIQDTLSIGSLSAKVLLGAMHAESHNFELPYADGVIGLAFQKGACHPNCIPPVMDTIAEQTGIHNIFTMCVTRFGGTLVLGKADTGLATRPYQYMKIQDTASYERFVIPAQSEWNVGDKSVSVPGVTAAMLSAGTSNIGVSKTTFLALLQHMMEHYCHVPGLCSMTSWFRPQRCAAIPDEAITQMPNITMGLARGISITLTPEDYIIKYRVIDGEQHRCVAFIASDSLAEKGIGLLLGTTIMRRYAIVYDRDERQVGIAPAKSGQCGPLTGSDNGLPGSAETRGNPGQVLTADAPKVEQKPEGSAALEQELFAAESCRAEKTCSGCARLSNCSYGYQTGRCVPIDEATSRPYPYCSGSFCACFAVEASGWYVGIAIGLLVGIALVSTVVIIYRKRRRRQQYQMVQPYEEQDLETF